MDRVLLSSARDGTGRDDWETPEEELVYVRSVLGQIALDPCAGPTTMIGLDNLRGPALGGLDGLSVPWSHSNFVNMPFSKLRRWAAKCAEEARHGRRIISLSAARTDTKAFHDSFATADALCFLKGRIRFKGAKDPCQFPVLFSYWGPDVKLFREVYGPRGMIVRP